jgi:hypothetical protein
MDFVVLDTEGKVGRERITQLNNSLNGKFKPFAKDDRIALDLTIPGSNVGFIVHLYVFLIESF